MQRGGGPRETRLVGDRNEVFELMHLHNERL